MLDISTTTQWQTTFPGGQIGILEIAGVDNQKRPSPLDAHKEAVVTAVRAQYADWDRPKLLELETLGAYKNYYKKFSKTYHVQLQLESILYKGRSLPNVSPLVDSAFAAEIKTHILTASHDVEKLRPPIIFDASDGSETMTQMNGKQRTLKANDMIMRDASGTVCTIIYGQDNISPITPQTSHALYIAYVPSGISTAIVEQHLEAMKQNVLLFAPDATVVQQRIFHALINCV